MKILFGGVSFICKESKDVYLILALHMWKKQKHIQVRISIFVWKKNGYIVE